MAKENPDLEVLVTALRESWGPDTCQKEEHWSTKLRARGQCVSSALVVQDYFGGDLLRFSVDGGSFAEKHYSNLLPDGTVIDTTYTQYEMPVSMRLEPVDLKGFASVREKRLADPSTKSRYLILKRRVAQRLHAI